MAEIFIKIKILDRTYSLKVEDPQQEALLRKAGKELESRLNIKREKLGVTDKQDLLAMIAFDSTVNEILKENQTKALCSDISQMDKEVSELLNKAPE